MWTSPLPIFLEGGGTSVHRLLKYNKLFMSDCVESLSCLFSSLNKSQPKGHLPRQSRQVKCTPCFLFVEYMVLWNI